MSNSFNIIQTVSNTRGYMNKATRLFKAKGYSVPEGLKAIGISLSSFRRYENKDSKHHNDLFVWIDELEIKKGEDL